MWVLHSGYVGATYLKRRSAVDIIQWITLGFCLMHPDLTLQLHGTFPRRLLAPLHHFLAGKQLQGLIPILWIGNKIGKIKSALPIMTQH